MEYYDEVVEVKRKLKLEKPTALDENSKNPSLNAVKNPPQQSFDDSERTTTKRPGSSLPRKSGASATKPAERLSSDTDSSDTDSEENQKISAESFDYKQWETLNVSSEIKEMYQYIAR